METKFEITPIKWCYENECDEQPTGVLVQVSNGDTEYMKIEEYKKLKNEFRIYTTRDNI
jgi:hypothetical protein